MKNKAYGEFMKTWNHARAIVLNEKGPTAEL